jgi:hypothetical protein
MAPNLAVGLAIRLGIGRFADLRSLGEPSFLLLRPALDAGGFETRPYVVCGWAAGSGPRRVTETAWPQATTRQQAWGRGRSDSRKAQSAGPRAKPERAKTDKSGVPATLRPNARTPEPIPPPEELRAGPYLPSQVVEPLMVPVSRPQLQTEPLAAGSIRQDY